MHFRFPNDALADTAEVNAADEVADVAAEAIALPALNVDWDVAESGADRLPLIKDTGASVWSHNLTYK